VLLCDVERPLHGAPMRALNRLFERVILRAAATRNDQSEHVGWVNRLYQPVGVLKDWLKRIKGMNKPVFNAIKYVFIAGSLYWIFLN
jgi:beta-hydroxylase